MDVLADDAEQPPDVVGRIVADVLAADPDLARVDLPEAEQGLTSVVLPEPLGPTIAREVPHGTSKLQLARTSGSSGP